ncbi:DUF6087 family protein [Streptomyces cacaoi]
MDDEPLSEWAKRRDERVGRLRAVPLICTDGPRGSHLNPHAPRVIQRWNGQTWEPHGLAADLAEAKRILYREAGEPPASVPSPTRRPFGTGTGRHRKPQAPRPVPDER